MRILGFTIKRENGSRVGSFQEAIEDVQRRLANIETFVQIRRTKVTREDEEQAEIQKVLAAGDGATAVQADDLLWGTG